MAKFDTLVNCGSVIFYTLKIVLTFSGSPAWLQPLCRSAAAESIWIYLNNVHLGPPAPTS